uniref:Putative F-box domain-containing protein n=1 Tax=Helianthus annuus TaxID=4232 RepID=A0A251T481_HELAN
MSDNIPFEIQELIMNKLPVEPLIRFRTVCKAWKSLIDSSDFIRNHIKQQNQQHLLVRYHDALHPELKFVSIPDNDDDTDPFPQHKVPVTVPQLVVNSVDHYTIIDSSHGLLCLFGPDDKAVIWNPSIRKAVDVVLPDMVGDGIYVNVLGFGVCPETIDPKVIKIRIYTEDVIPWQVEVFTLSTRVWRSAYSSNVPSKCFWFGGEQVVVGGVVYFLVSDRVDGRDGCDRLAHTHCNLSMLKPRESLVAIEGCVEDSELVYHVWVMKDGVPKLFEKLFTISGHSPYGSLNSVRGFRKTGEALVELQAHPVDVALHLFDRDVEEISAYFLGFGVCQKTRDLKIFKITIEGMEGVVPWQVEVFTLSTRVWRSAYSSNVQSKFVIGGEQVVVDGVVYWRVNGDVSDRADGEGGYGNFIVSFDLTSEEFGELKLPDRLANTRCSLCMFKSESLAVIEAGLEDYTWVSHVWVMKDGSNCKLILVPLEHLLLMNPTLKPSIILELVEGIFLCIPTRKHYFCLISPILQIRKKVFGENSI